MKSFIVYEAMALKDINGCNNLQIICTMLKHFLFHRLVKKTLKIQISKFYQLGILMDTNYTE